jgi:disulfide bond formation protein DsbB
MRNTPKQYAVPMMMVAGIPLIFAHFIGNNGSYPTTLCLYDQYIWWAVLAVWGLMMMTGTGNMGRVGSVLSALLVICGIILSGFQIGVEQQWWTNIFACNLATVQQSTVVQGSQALAQQIGSCDPPTYLMPDVPVSLAVLNLIYEIAYLFIFFTVIPL